MGACKRQQTRCLLKLMPGSVLVLALFVLMAGHAHAASGPSLELRLDRTEATFEDTVTLQVKVSGAGSLSTPPQIAGLEKSFTVVAGGTSSHIEIVNFSKSEYIQYLYYLSPKASGTFRIGPAEVTVGGKVYRSNTASIIVRDASTTRTGSDVEAEGPLFLKAELSKASAYAEEPVIYTLRLYRLVKVSNLSLDIPDIKGLSFRKLGEPSQYEATVQGQPYHVLEVRYEVTASSKGRFKVPPAAMAMTVFEQDQRQRGFPFNDPFFGFSAPRKKTIRSNPLELTVRELPPSGRPAGFSSLVGSFKMSSSLDRAQIAAGETATLTVTVEGRGNVNRIPDLLMPEIEGIRIYPDRTALQTGTGADGFSGVKTMKWAFVPQKEGTYEIPKLTLSYFDTASQAYRVLTTPAHTLTVRQGVVSQSAPQTPPSPAPGPGIKKEVEEVGRDILPVHTELSGIEGSTGVLPEPYVLWLVLVLPPVGLGLAHLMKRRMSPSSKDEAHAKARGALKAFLKEAKPDVSAASLLDAVRAYFNARFGSSLGALTPEDAGAILERRKVEADLRKRCVEIVSELTQKVYTGMGSSHFDRADELASLLREIDRKA